MYTNKCHSHAVLLFLSFFERRDVLVAVVVVAYAPKSIYIVVNVAYP